MLLWLVDRPRWHDHELAGRPSVTSRLDLAQLPLKAVELEAAYMVYPSTGRSATSARTLRPRLGYRMRGDGRELRNRRIHKASGWVGGGHLQTPSHQGWW